MIQKKFLSSQSLESFIKSQTAALLMFSTPLCNACNKQEAIINNFWEKRRISIDSYKVNIESKGNVLNYIAKMYKAKSFPFMIIVKGGKINKSFSGTIEGDSLMMFIESAIIAREN